MNYAHLSHEHCWNNPKNPCGIAQHTQCCLCDLKAPTPPSTESWEKELKEIKESFLEYSSEGYAGGSEGLRCSTCDRKYAGTSEYGQLCAVCKVEKVIHSLLLKEREKLREKIEGMRVDKFGHPGRPFYGTSAARSYASNYNQALDDLLKSL